MSYTTEGTLIAKFNKQQVSDTFAKREFVLEISEEVNGNVYKNYAKFQLVQNKCDILDRFSEGDIVRVNWNLKGNRWEKDGKINYATNLDAWKLEETGMNQSRPVQQSYSQPAQPPANNFLNPSPGNVDDLPF